MCPERHRALRAATCPEKSRTILKFSPLEQTLGQWCTDRLAGPGGAGAERRGARAGARAGRRGRPGPAQAGRKGDLGLSPGAGRAAGTPALARGRRG